MSGFHKRTWSGNLGPVSLQEQRRSEELRSRCSVRPFCTDHPRFPGARKSTRRDPSRRSWHTQLRAHYPPALGPLSLLTFSPQTTLLPLAPSWLLAPRARLGDPTCSHGPSAPTSGLSPGAASPVALGLTARGFLLATETNQVPRERWPPTLRAQHRLLPLASLPHHMNKSLSLCFPRWGLGCMALGLPAPLSAGNLPPTQWRTSQMRNTCHAPGTAVHT